MGGNGEDIISNMDICRRNILINVVLRKGGVYGELHIRGLNRFQSGVLLVFRAGRAIVMFGALHGYIRETKVLRDFPYIFNKMCYNSYS